MRLAPTYQCQIIAHLSHFRVISLLDHNIFSNMIFKIQKAIWYLDLSGF